MAITSFSGKFHFLSNFYVRELVYSGRRYVSAEHAFQAAKATNDKDRKYIANAATPREAKRRGREIGQPLDWFSKSINVMRCVVHAKFKDQTLAAQLLATGDELLIEGNTWNDKFWGVVQARDGKWIGQNWLGKILVEERAALRGLRSKAD